MTYALDGGGGYGSLAGGSIAGAAAVSSAVQTAIVGGVAAAVTATYADELYDAGESAWNFISGNVSSVLAGNDTPPDGSDEALAVASEIIQGQIQDKIFDALKDLAGWCNSNTCGSTLNQILATILAASGATAIPIPGVIPGMQTGDLDISQVNEGDDAIPIPYDLPLDPPDDHAEPVYRLGSYNARNLTPRPQRDVPSGLSLTTTTPSGRAVKFQGGIPHLVAVGFVVEPAPSTSDPAHILVKPGIMQITLGYNLADWAATRDDLDNNNPTTWYALTTVLYLIGERF